MNKKRLKLKHRKNTVRVTYEPDYDHEAWESATRPTPETVPEAFYMNVEPAHPKPPAPTRREPHRSLTTAMLRRRLYYAGVRGAEAKRVLAEIMAGEPSADGLAVPMSWSASGFRKYFGQRLARVVLNFVEIMFIMIDEFSACATPVMADWMQKAMKTGRKYSGSPVIVEQITPTAAVVLTRRVSFHL